MESSFRIQILDFCQVKASSIQSLEELLKSITCANVVEFKKYRLRSLLTGAHIKINFSSRPYFTVNIFILILPYGLKIR